MTKEQILQEAKALQEEIKSHRLWLHTHAETGFDLTETKPYVKSALRKMGYTVQECGKAGLVTTVGKPGGKVLLLRADMDALPIAEEADVDFACQNGRMHACGHDMHTAMLLGAAKILKAHESELDGMVKLMFQPGEETLEGAQDMLAAGVLENPKVDAGLMIHSMTGMPFPKGMVAILDGGRGMASCDQYKITVKGKGGHGAMPHLTIDPITAAAHIQVGLAELHSRELEPGTFGVVTTGMFHAGGAPNVIADNAVMEGTIRTGDIKVEKMLMDRLTEIAKTIAKAYRCEADVEFVKHCPPMISDLEVGAATTKYMKELLGDGAVPMSVIAPGNKVSGGSEDFAFISNEIPACALMLATVGDDKENYAYPQHHPKANFNDEVLYEGTASYVYVATRWLEEHK